MKILLLGSDGFLGKNLKYFFEEKGIKCLEFSKKNNKDLKNKIKRSSFIIHLADKIKSNKRSHFDESLEFTKKIISEIKKSNKKKYLIYASSINTNKKNNLHYNLKRNTEKLLKTKKYFDVYILKLPNIFGIWQGLALEQSAGLDLQSAKPDAAKAKLEQIIKLTEIPQSLRQRAQRMLDIINS